MRALLVALWLAWATVVAGYRTPALSQRDDAGVRIANRDELAVLTGAATLRWRLVDAREPPPEPVPGLPPLWVSRSSLGVVLPARTAAIALRALEARRARDGLFTARTSRGPPLGALQTRV